MQDILKIYDPANSANVTPEQVAAMEALTPDEISALAKQYPNGPQGNAYLVLRDTTQKEEAQLFPVSTWQNLAELHRIGQKQFVAAGYTSTFKKKEAPKVAATQDLTKEEAQNELRNVTTAAPQNASFAKDTNDSLVNTDGQGETGAVTKPLQGGDIAGQSETLDEETKNKIAQGENRVEGMNEGEEFSDEIPLQEMTKAGLQEKYEEAFGAKPKEAWNKAQLIEAIQSGVPVPAE